jgi:hypothetical protein
MAVVRHSRSGGFPPSAENPPSSDGFDQLTIGTRVAFVEERGEQGPQVSTVRVLGKHHYITP